MPFHGVGLQLPYAALLGGGRSLVSPSASFLPANSMTAPNISAGSHAALQWERTQAWSAIGFIKVATPPVLNGAGMIFTTCNQGHNSGGSSAFTGYEFWIDNVVGHVGVLRVRIINNIAGPNYIGIFGTTNVCDGQRHKVAATYDGSSTAAGVKIYVDGVLETMTVESNTLSASIINKMPLWIGNQLGWPYSLGGTLEQFSLSNTVRSLGAIQAYTTAAAALDANTVLAYSFSEGAGKITSDLSASGFVGAMNGAKWASGAVGNAPYQIQGKLGPDLGNVPASTSAVTLDNVVGNGNSVLVTIEVAGTGSYTCADDKGNPYASLGTNTSLAGTHMETFLGVNLTNGPRTFTVTGPGTTAYWRVLADEIVNLKSPSPAEASASFYNSATPATTDGLSSGNLAPTPVTSFDFIYGVASNFSAAAVTNGTGFTPLTSGTSADNEPLWSEYQFQAVAGAIAATWTVTGGASLAVSMGLALKSA